MQMVFLETYSSVFVHKVRWATPAFHWWFCWMLHHYSPCSNSNFVLKISLILGIVTPALSSEIFLLLFPNTPKRNFLSMSKTTKWQKKPTLYTSNFFSHILKCNLHYNFILGNTNFVVNKRMVEDIYQEDLVLLNQPLLEHCIDLTLIPWKHENASQIQLFGAFDK